MAKKVYLIYQGDAWLSKDSLTVKGVFTDLDKAKREIINDMSDALEFDDEHTADDALRELDLYSQTQGFEWNYMIESVNLNEWLK